MRSGIVLFSLVMIALSWAGHGDWSAQAMPVQQRQGTAADIPAMTDAAPSRRAEDDLQAEQPAMPLYPFLPELDGTAFRTNGDQSSTLAYRRWLIRHRQWLQSFRAGLVPTPTTGLGQAASGAGAGDRTSRSNRRPVTVGSPYFTELEFVFVSAGSGATKRSSNATGDPVYETAFAGWLAAHFVDAGGVGEEPEFMGKVGLNLVGSFFELIAGDDELALLDDRVVKIVKVRVPTGQNQPIVDLGHFPDALNGPFLLPGMNVGRVESNLLRSQIGNTAAPGQALADGGGDRPRAPKKQEPEDEAETRQKQTLIGFFLLIVTDIAAAPMTYVVFLVLLLLWLVSRRRTVSGH